MFEETGGNPEKIEVLTVNRDTICSVITEYHPPNVKTWERKDNQFRAIFDPVKTAHLACPDDKIISKVEFVSFGEAEGACGVFRPGKCDSPKAHKVVEEVKLCVLYMVLIQLSASSDSYLIQFISMQHVYIYGDNVINAHIYGARIDKVK